MRPPRTEKGKSTEPTESGPSVVIQAQPTTPTTSTTANVLQGPPTTAPTINPTNTPVATNPPTAPAAASFVKQSVEQPVDPPDQQPAHQQHLDQQQDSDALPPHIQHANAFFTAVPPPLWTESIFETWMDDQYPDSKTRPGAIRAWFLKGLERISETQPQFKKLCQSQAKLVVSPVS